jgi:hypothetical protein
VLTDAGTLQRNRTKSDQEKLDEYFQSIREIETRIGKEEQWLGVPKTKPASPLQEPAGEIAGHQEIKAMYDIIVAALQTDATRVFTYRQPVGSLLTSLGIRMSAHTMSHYDPGPRMDASQARDQKQSELLAYFIDRLKATKEPDGSSLFDHTVLSYGSNISSRRPLQLPRVMGARGETRPASCCPTQRPALLRLKVSSQGCLSSLVCRLSVAASQARGGRGASSPISARWPSAKRLGAILKESCSESTLS